MSERVIPFGLSEHSAADVLLPFYVNGTLRGEELAFVREHVEGCEQCRREVDWLHTVYAACASSPLFKETTDGVSASPALVVPHNSVDRRRLGIRTGWRAAQPWTRWLIAAQLAAIVVLATLLASPDSRQAASYRTLGSANPVSETRDTVVVRFDAAITAAELRRIVLGVDARIVDGPSATDVFVLALPAEQIDQALAALRAEPAVRVAERLGPRLAR